MKNIVWIALIFSLILPSCSSDRQGGQGPTASDMKESAVKPGTPAADRYALEISPSKVVNGSTVNLIVTGFDIRDARIDWLLNGAIVESANPTQCRLSDARRGDTLQARALIQGREILSNKVEIVNALPEVAGVRILPEVIKPGDALSVAAEGKDADGDEVTFLYEWTVNGKPAGNKEKIGAPIKRGDKVCVRVTPCDREGQGRSLVLNKEIQNHPPIIQEHGEFDFDGAVYSYQIKASDPDDDALAYSLEGAPDGMTINKTTGLIMWKVPAEFKGDSGVTAVVNDGNGGVARYNLKILIK
jgi:Putative Ig domain